MLLSVCSLLLAAYKFFLQIFYAQDPLQSLHGNGFYSLGFGGK